MRLLDRYVLRSFLMPFLYCFLGFIAIWLVFDLQDNISDFMAGDVSIKKIIGFYISQLPDTTIFCLPPAILMGLLYSMGKMSRSNEIISMLTAGVSLPRVILPLLVFGLLATAGVTALNYHLAPKAQANKQRVLRELTGNRQDDQLVAHVFANRRENRLWYVEKVMLDKGLCRGVQIRQQDPDGRLQYQYYVRNAYYRPQDDSWYFDKGVVTKYDKEGNLTEKDYLHGETIITGWDETPWRIASSNMKAQYLTVPELQDYLKFNSDFASSQLAPFRTHLLNRWALPWECFIMVLIAAPLGIVYSRRGVLAGVAWSVFIFAGLYFMKGLFMSLGEGARVQPFWAAIAPSILFIIGGLFLLWMRATNRDPGSLNPFRIVRERRALKRI